MTKDNTSSPKRKYFAWCKGVRLFGFDIELIIQRKEYKEHLCLNQVMDGDYQCEVCNP